MSPLVFALALAARAAVPAPVEAAVTAALSPPNARGEVIDLQGGLPTGCVLRAAEFPRPIGASGRQPIHLLGTSPRCEAWGWVSVRVLGPVLVTTRAVAAGTPLAGATEPRLQELVVGHATLDALPDGAIARRDLAPGVPLAPSVIRVGPAPGEPVSVLLRVGTLTVEQSGRAIPCQRGRVCALLPSGRRVEGSWHGGRIELETP